MREECVALCRGTFLLLDYLEILHRQHVAFHTHTTVRCFHASFVCKTRDCCARNRCFAVSVHMLLVTE